MNVQLDYSLNFGMDPMSESVLCCDSDGCNKQTLPGKTNKVVILAKQYQLKIFKV